MTIHVPLDGIDHRPLSDVERQLIHAAETQAWNEELRWALAEAVSHRGVRVGTFDTCGDLVDALELIAQRS